MFNKMRIKILEKKIEKTERVVEILEGKVEILERKVEILENNPKPQLTPFEEDDKNKLTYSEVIDEWLNGERKGNGK